MKTCTKCHNKYPTTVEYFYIGKQYRNGLRSWCKICWKKYYQTEKGKTAHCKANKKYYQTIRGYLQSVYRDMKRRCTNPNHLQYKNYGGREIKCLFTSAKFLDYVISNLGYDTIEKLKGLQIDRIDNDGHYEPDNIRFTTAKVNANNRRNKER